MRRVSSSLALLLYGVIRFTAYKIVVPGQTENSVLVCVDQTQGLVEIESNTDGIDGKPFAIPLDFGFVIGNNDFPDVAFQLAARVDSFKAEHLIEDNIVGAVRLAH